jgi:predicted nucleic acid-binding protein
METLTFIDTSAIVALYAGDDAAHQRAVSWLRDNADVRYATHRAVILEATALLDRRLGTNVCDRFLDEFVPMIEVHVGDELDYVQTFSAFRAGRSRRGPSMTDRTSFQLMRDHGMTRAFTFDRHFADAGFEVVPAP